MTLRLARLTNSTFLFLSINGIVILWGRALILSLFIKQAGVELLPLALLLDGFVVMGTTYFYGRLLRNVERPILLWGLGMLIAVLVWIGRASVGTGNAHGIVLMFIALRLFIDVFDRYATQYVTFFYTSKHDREGFFSALLAGRAVQGIITLLLIPMVVLFNAQQLVTIWIVAIIASALMVIWLSETLKVPQSASDAIIDYVDDQNRFQSSGDLFSLLKNGLIRWLTLSALGISIIASIILFRGISIISKNMTDFQALVTFFAVINGLGIWIALPLKYYLLSRLLRQLNAGRLAYIYPLSLNVAFLLLLVLPGLATSALGEFARTALRISLYEPIERLLHHALPGGIEGWSRRFIDSYVEPFGHILGAIIIWIGVETVPYTGLPLFLEITVVGVFVLFAANRAGFFYTQMLASTLQVGQYRFIRHAAGEWGPNDTAGIGYLIDELKDLPFESRRALMIAEVISQSHIDEAYHILLNRYAQSPSNIQAELLPIIINNWMDHDCLPVNQKLIHTALDSSISDLRRSALRLVAIYPSLDPNYRVARLIVDPDPEVNIVSAAVLLHHPSAEIQSAARSQLRWLARHRKASVRIMAVRSLVQGSLDHYGEILVPIDVTIYLTDPATRVREAAIGMASMQQLVEAICDPSTNVQTAAINHLKLRRFEGSRRHILRAIATLVAISKMSPHLQIANMLCHWRLVIAFTEIGYFKGKRRLFSALEDGFEQLDVIDSMAYTIKNLNEPALRPVLTQLHEDYQTLLETMIELLSVTIGRTHTNAIFWTMHKAIENNEIIKARKALLHITNETLANRFEHALRTKPGESERLESGLPQAVFSALLGQFDDWRPLITLYSILNLPKERRTWLDPAQINALLEDRASSKDPSIREATRLLHQFYKEQAPIHHLPTTIDDQVVQLNEVIMLSILERMVFLRNVSFFGDLRLDQLRALARVCDEFAFAEGKYIIKQGDVGEGLYIIIEGSVRIEREFSDNRPPVNLFSLEQAEVFGEISLLDGGVRTANVIAETAVLLLGIKRDALDDALEDDPSIAMGMLRAMADRVRRSTETIDNLKLSEEEATRNITD